VLKTYLSGKGAAAGHDSTTGPPSVGEYSLAGNYRLLSPWSTTWLVHLMPRPEYADRTIKSAERLIVVRPP